VIPVDDGEPDLALFSERCAWHLNRRLELRVGLMWLSLLPMLTTKLDGLPYISDHENAQSPKDANQPQEHNPAPSTAWDPGGDNQEQQDPPDSDRVPLRSTAGEFGCSSLPEDPYSHVHPRPESAQYDQQEEIRAELGCHEQIMPQTVRSCRCWSGAATTP